MKRYAGYAALLIGAYLIFVLTQLPAAYVVYRLQSANSLPVALYQVDGTLWRGQARSAVIADQAAGPLDWTFRPHALLAGRAEFSLALNRNGGRLDMVAGRSLDGTVYMRDARLAMTLNDVVMLAGQPDMGLTGRVSADLRRANLGEAGITALEGRVEITGAGVGPPVNVALGGFTIDIETSGDVIRGTIRDDNGPLQADGVIVLSPDGSYRLNAGLSARDPADTQLAQALAMIGTPGAGGRVMLTQQGRIALPIR
jgi:hypothetical protein